MKMKIIFIRKMISISKKYQNKTEQVRYYYVFPFSHLFVRDKEVKKKHTRKVA
ncbi:MAG: hypothetical protein JSV88_28005 [Candidatus Aminicenantes bacterium]|nr:MAG: hypothetical protein JSV88_28005 [Candidatus Aminicenantes bacterium]